MVGIRIIPCLQLLRDSLVKTVRFKDPVYIGDPVNTVRIFNELEVDELCFTDIRASIEAYPPNFNLLEDIAGECFMPLSYGGGIRDFDTAKRIFSLGFEKIIVNSIAFENPELLQKLSEHFGSQAIIAAMDVKKNLFGTYHVYAKSARINQK